MTIELLHTPGCPNAGPVRRLLRSCLAELGIEATLVEREGTHPSPTLLIGGRDVMGGAPSVEGSACRLDIPTRDDILRALQRSAP
jgi:hypothetical protein